MCIHFRNLPVQCNFQNYNYTFLWAITIITVYNKWYGKIEANAVREEENEWQQDRRHFYGSKRYNGK